MSPMPLLLSLLTVPSISRTSLYRGLLYRGSTVEQFVSLQVPHKLLLNSKLS